MHDSEKLKEAMAYILEVEGAKIIEGTDFSMLSKYWEE